MALLVKKICSKKGKISSQCLKSRKRSNRLLQSLGHNYTSPALKQTFRDAIFFFFVFTCTFKKMCSFTSTLTSRPPSATLCALLITGVLLGLLLWEMLLCLTRAQKTLDKFNFARAAWHTIRCRELSFSLLYLTALCLIWPRTCINCLIVPTIFHVQLEMESKCTCAKRKGTHFHPFWPTPGSLFTSCPLPLFSVYPSIKGDRPRTPGREGQSREGQQHTPAAPLTMEEIPWRSPVISAVPLDFDFVMIKDTKSTFVPMCCCTIVSTNNQHYEIILKKGFNWSV